MRAEDAGNTRCGWSDHVFDHDLHMANSATLRGQLLLWRGSRDDDPMGPMRSFIGIAAFALVSSLGWANDRPAGIPEEAKYGKVDRVYDGDTLVLMGGSRDRVIRLDGIDAPERDQPYGPVATAALEYMVGRAIYYVETGKNDQYKVVVATLYHSKEGYNINASLVCAGFAWWYERYAPDNKLLEGCQKEAQEAPKGLWEDEDPIPPWEWRSR